MKLKSVLPITLLTLTMSVSATVPTDFKYVVDRFADIEVLRYQVPGFDDLTLKQKEYIYYLTQAAIEGRDILFDQNNKYNLTIRKLIENIYTNYNGDRNSADFKGLEKYLKQIWFSNGIHHHYSMDKHVPEFSRSFLKIQIMNMPNEMIPGIEKMSRSQFCNKILSVIFDPEVMSKRVNQAPGIDIITNSANNLYNGVTQQEVEDYYNKLKDPNDLTPISYGLNSRMSKKDGKLIEEVYCANGRYGKTINKIIEWLEKALLVAENDSQKKIITSLISFYRTGDLKTFDEYSILWAEDTKSDVDFINGFIESYGDPLGMRASWESMVNFRNIKASERTTIIGNNAMWFEQNSPVNKLFKKDKVKGVSAKVITAAMLGGDCYPATPIGINLPNASWIRAQHGSKSVTIENLTSAYDKASQGNGFAEEFVYSDYERDLMEKYLFMSDNIEVDLHECLGHGSGKLLPGVDPDALKEHGSTLEETRADLFALYYIADPKMIELGLLPNADAYKAQYYKYMLNGLMTQLMRILPDNDIEESHMRNRQLIAQWVYQNGKSDKVMELVKKNGKTYLKINDYVKLRTLIGKLLAEIQRIKSEGDYQAGKELVEKYAVKVDKKLHKEVLDRYAKLDIAPYKGFVNPVYKVKYDNNGNITNIVLDYTEGYVDQMLRYSKEYSSLPTWND